MQGHDGRRASLMHYICKTSDCSLKYARRPSNSPERQSNTISQAALRCGRCSSVSKSRPDDAARLHCRCWSRRVNLRSVSTSISALSPRPRSFRAPAHPAVPRLLLTYVEGGPLVAG